jgi:hypothetical protein
MAFVQHSEIGLGSMDWPVKLQKYKCRTKVGDAVQQAYFRTQLLKKRANASDDFLIFLQSPAGLKGPENEREGAGE